MNVVRRQSDHHTPITRRNKNDASSTSSTSFNFYFDIPSFELSLDEFEELALSRLKILRKIETLKSRGVTGDKYRTALSSAIKQHLPPSSDPKADIASHFILRAAYCRTEDLRRWFLTQECHLFRHRLQQQRSQVITPSILSQINITFEILGDAEKMTYREQLLSIPGITPADFVTSTYYKIPFLEALELVKSRKCVLSDGWAYVPLSNLVSIVSARFRMKLSQSLAHASRAWGGVDERVSPLLRGMDQTYVGKDYANDAEGMDDKDRITPENVEALAMRSMPLCMRQLHQGMKRDGKLKYDGRMQYILFLKGSGMTMEDTLIFFERVFTKIMSKEEFKKQYAYSIRHLHGKEGKRVAKRAYDCRRIIMGSWPQAGQHHGCPYKHYDEERLSAVLDKLSLQKGTLVKILDHKKRGNFNLACLEHFEATHPKFKEKDGIQLDELGNHPNAWFQASRSFHDAVAVSAAGTGTATATATGM